MPRGTPGNSVGGTVARWHPGGRIALTGANGSVIAAVRNGELCRAVGASRIASENAETEGQTCMME
jgi:hypothetical protein